MDGRHNGAAMTSLVLFDGFARCVFLRNASMRVLPHAAISNSPIVESACQLFSSGKHFFANSIMLR